MIFELAPCTMNIYYVDLRWRGATN